MKPPPEYWSTEDIAYHQGLNREYVTDDQEPQYIEAYEREANGFGWTFYTCTQCGACVLDAPRLDGTQIHTAWHQEERSK